MHDFLITRDYVIFPVLPLVVGMDVLQKTGSLFGWQPERGAHFGIMPRNGDGKDVKWLAVEPFMTFHYFNAYNEGSTVVVYTPAYDCIYHWDLQGNPAPIDPHQLHCEVVKWTFDLKTGTVKKEVGDNLPCEYPRTDPRYIGRKWRHTYINAWIPNHRPPQHGGSWPHNGLVHYDHQTGKRKLREFRPGTWTTPEPAFVPRTPDAPEGDGYLLCLLYREDENRSDIEVLDTQDITAEPVATVKLPTRVVYGAHCQYMARNPDGSLQPAGL